MITWWVLISQKKLITFSLTIIFLCSLPCNQQHLRFNAKQIVIAPGKIRKIVFSSNDKRYHCTELCLASTNIFCLKSPSINFRFPSAFLNVTNRPQYCGRPEMILTFPKNTSWILWSMKSNVQVFNWHYWSCHSGPARLGEIGNGYGDLYCGSRSLMDIEFDWSIARGT